MVYVDPWDLTTPGDLSDAGEGDDKMREMKRALDERLTTVFTNWADGDPLIVKKAALEEATFEGLVTILHGATADKPNPPTAEFFFDTDENQLYVTNTDDSSYIPVFPDSQILMVDVVANLPDPATVPFFWATDTLALYVNENGAYKNVAGSEFGKVKGAKVSLTADAAAVRNDRIEIPWDVEVYDDGDYYDPASLASPHEIVITESGIYQIIVNLRMRIEDTGSGVDGWHGVIVWLMQALNDDPFPASPSYPTDVIQFYGQPMLHTSPDLGLWELQFVSERILVDDVDDKRFRTDLVLGNFPVEVNVSVDDNSFMELIRLGDAP